MDRTAALWLLATSILSLLLAAGSVIVSFREASRSTRVRKWLREQVLTKTSEPRVAKLEADQAELFLILEKLTTALKRVTSRAGMQELREKRGNAPPPPGASKAELRRYYGIAGVPGPEVAARQLRGEANGE